MSPELRYKRSAEAWTWVYGTDKVDEKRENFVRSKAFYLLFRNILEPAALSADLMIPAAYERVAFDFLSSLLRLFPGFQVTALNRSQYRRQELQLSVIKDNAAFYPGTIYRENRPLSYLLNRSVQQANGICAQCGRRIDNNSKRYPTCIYCRAKEKARKTREQNGL